MPELAEVEFYRKRWSVGHGAKVIEVQTHPRARIYRETNAQKLPQWLGGATLKTSETAAKQMLYQFSGGHWLGIHLGMTGELRAEPIDYFPQKHDHLVLTQEKHCLVFSDPRMFGLVQYHHGRSKPHWWTSIAPAILSSDFTKKAISAFLKRRARTNIKAVLLMQEQFPGIGNWMADEILWRAAIHPRRLAGALTVKEQHTLWKECRQVCRLALRNIAGHGNYLPPDLNVHIPNTWLFNHRWRDGHYCPRTHTKLVREEIGGRTTCWSPGRQKL